MYCCEKARRQQQPPPQKPIQTQEQVNSLSQANLIKTRSTVIEVPHEPEQLLQALLIPQQDAENVQQEQFQQKIIELQNLIQEKQAELEAINLINASNKSLNGKSQTPILKVPSAVVVQAPIEVVEKVEKVQSSKKLSQSPLTITPGHSVGRQSSAFTVVQQLKTSEQIVKQPSVELVTKVPSSVSVNPQFDDVALLIQQAFNTQIVQEAPLINSRSSSSKKVAPQITQEPVLINSKSSSSKIAPAQAVPQEQIPVKSASTVKSPSTAKLQRSISNTKPPQPPQGASRQASYTKFKVPEGYTLAQPRYIGSISAGSGINLDYLQSLVDQHSKKSEFADTHLEDIEYNAFIDPFTSNLFQDEVIEIDYGAIDAFTNALSSHIDIEARGPQHDLKTNSHILEGKFSSFVDNQLLLGDYIDASLQFTSFDAFNQEYQNRNLKKTSSNFNVNSSSQNAASKVY